MEQIGGEQAAGLGLEEGGPLAARRLTALHGAKAGSTQHAARSTRRTVAGLTLCPRRRSSPCTRWKPHREFSAPSRMIRSRTSSVRAGRPGGRRLRPLLLRQTLMPEQQGARGNDPVPAQGSGQQSGERGKQRPVRPAGPGHGDLPAQHRDLVPQDENLRVLRRGGSTQQSKPREDPHSEQVDHPYEYEDRSCPTADRVHHPRSAAVKQF